MSNRSKATAAPVDVAAYVRKCAAAMAEVLASRMGGSGQLSDFARQFAGMSLLEMARDHLELLGRSTRGLDRFALVGEALSFRSGMLGTTDFPAILADAGNRRLRAGYEQAATTYQAWARRGPDANDFKSIQVVQLSAAPDLLRTSEHEEFQYGTLKDGGETYGVVTYGRIVRLTRQALVNDDLRAFGRMAEAMGAAARRLENRLVYAQLTANANMADGVPLFHASHGNLGTGAASALDLEALAEGRRAMRLQKGLAGEELALAPAHLLVPASLEQVAHQLTSSAYVPAKPADVNEFRQGGRASLDPIVEPLLDSASSAAWYLSAGSSQVDTVEYCYLAGHEAPSFDVKEGFEFDGVAFRGRHDFGAKVIDHRGLYRGNGL